jgi:predicted membrane protein
MWIGPLHFLSRSPSIPSWDFQTILFFSFYPPVSAIHRVYLAESLLSLVYLVFIIVFLVKIENMDFDNKHDERRHWREERRRWRRERHGRWEDGKNFMSEKWNDRHQSGSSSVWTGILLLLIGTDYFLVNSHPPILPEWMWSWEVLLIGMGLFIGIRHNFRSPAWFILMVVGGVFLIKSDDFAKYFPGLNVNHIWPLALIILGLFFILRPHRRHRWQNYVNDKVESKIDEAMAAHSEPSDVKDNPTPQPAQASLSEDFIDSTSIFGGVKKNIISKNFKGGDITNIMGGSEIDLTQADIHGTVRIDLTQVFGGTKLIVPSNWQVKAQMAAIFGGVEDKRSIQNTALDPNKILLLDGTSIFGGIEIRSY